MKLEQERWQAIAEGHRDDMREKLTTRDDMRDEQLARAADAVAAAIQCYDAIAATKP